MADTFWPLGLATLSFVGGHLLLSALRGPLIARVGRLPFLGLYSLAVLAAFVWMCLAFAEAPYRALWAAPGWNPWPALVLMAPASVLLVCGYLIANPTALFLDRLAAMRDDPAPGIVKVTRHPVMWAVALWSVAHIASRNDLASLIFFGGFGVLALAGAAHIDRRRRHEDGADWRRLASVTSFVPFVAALQGRTRISLAGIGWWRIALGLVVWLALAHFHGRIAGISVAPWNGG